MRNAGPRRLLQEQLRPADVRVARLTVGVRGAVDYGFDAVYGSVETRARQQVALDRTGPSAPAENANFAAHAAQTIHDPPSEHAGTACNQDLVHPRTSFDRSGGTARSFSGLTTMRMARMLPSATSKVVTLWGRPSSK